jgi:hypothetical protein
VRADGRQRELAVRAALGAGWARIARELLVESSALGVVGGALGLALAGAALRLLLANGPANLPRLEEIGIDPVVLLFALGVALLSNSITCGTGSDQSEIPCGKGVWQDQHNAYLSYGSITAKELNAQFHLSAVSGIGLMRSCCNMNILMPKVFDKISMRNDTINWDFNKFQPDVVTICLGQNDGIQDSAAITDNYIAFIKKLRGYYQNAKIVCLSSPMGNAALTTFMKKILPVVVAQIYKAGDRNVTSYIFSKQYSKGCDSHPDLEEHGQIAEELTAFIREKMNW